MEKVTCKLTVLFENPFWIGFFERKEGRNLSVAKVIFGAEPKEHDVYEFIQKNYYDLQFSPVVKVHTEKSARNPKRRQREAYRQIIALYNYSRKILYGGCGMPTRKGEL